LEWGVHSGTREYISGVSVIYPFSLAPRFSEVHRGLASPVYLHPAEAGC